MKKLLLILTICSMTFVFIACGGTDEKETDDKIMLTYGGAASGFEPQLLEELIVEFEAIHTNIKVKRFATPPETDNVRALYFQMFESKSSDVDVFQADVVWVGEMEDHLINLSEYPESVDLSTNMFPSIVENNTIDGNLVAMPLFPDSSYLYYRKDLLEKYGYENPPVTYEEMTEMATTIQDGERAAGNADFVGFVFQGNSYEGLVCNALEWIASYNGGSFIESDGRVSINNENAIEALELAQSWIGTISPAGVTGMNEDSATQVFQSGNALFLRNWIAFYAMLTADDSVVKDKTGISLLPTGIAQGTHAGALGGWQLAANKYSKHPEEAVMLLNFMASKQTQKKRAMVLNNSPAYVELYLDTELSEFIRDSKDVYENTVARPSSAAAPYYGEVSRYISSTIHDVLIGNMTARDAVGKLELDLEEVMGKVKETQN